MEKKCVRKVEETLSFELPLPKAGELLDPKLNTGVVFNFHAETKE